MAIQNDFYSDPIRLPLTAGQLFIETYDSQPPSGPTIPGGTMTTPLWYTWTPPVSAIGAVQTFSTDGALDSDAQLALYRKPGWDSEKALYGAPGGPATSMWNGSTVSSWGVKFQLTTGLSDFTFEMRSDSAHSWAGLPGALLAFVSTTPDDSGQLGSASVSGPATGSMRFTFSLSTSLDAHTPYYLIIMASNDAGSGTLLKRVGLTDTNSSTYGSGSYWEAPTGGEKSVLNGSVFNAANNNNPWFSLQVGAVMALEYPLSDAGLEVVATGTGTPDATLTYTPVDGDQNLSFWLCVSGTSGGMQCNLTHPAGVAPKPTPPVGIEFFNTAPGYVVRTHLLEPSNDSGNDITGTVVHTSTTSPMTLEAPGGRVTIEVFAANQHGLSIPVEKQLGY